MYIEKFWIENYLDEAVFSVDFRDRAREIRRWSLFQDEAREHTGVEKNLFFKLMAVCVGGSRFIPGIRNDIAQVYGKRNDIYKCGVVLRSDTVKVGRKTQFSGAKV